MSIFNALKKLQNRCWSFIAADNSTYWSFQKGLYSIRILHISEMYMYNPLIRVLVCHLIKFNHV